MGKYKCIIFDCDGVLVDSEPLSNKVMVDIANELGANINLDYALRNFKGNSFDNCANQISELIGRKVPDNLEVSIMFCCAFAGYELPVEEQARYVSR